MLCVLSETGAPPCTPDRRDGYYPYQGLRIDLPRVGVAMGSEPVDVLRRNNVTVSGPDDAPVVMFAHGFGCSQAAWRRVAPAFAVTHRVVLFDHVGSGDSDVAAYDRGKYDSLHGYATDVLEVADALALHDITFVGHSVGAMIGVLAANREPGVFRRLVLVGPSPRYIDDEGYRGGFAEEDIHGLLDALDQNYLGWSASMAPVIMGNPDRPELGEELTRSFCRVDPAIARQFAGVTFLSDNRADLADVRVPTHVIQSSQDAIAPIEVGRFVHESIPGSTFTLLTSTGHLPNLAGPSELVDELTRCLA